LTAGRSLAPAIRFESRACCPRFTENIEFYLKLGYRVDREEDVGGGTMNVGMSKTLGPGPLA
jgi:hypothetical protein